MKSQNIESNLLSSVLERKVKHWKLKLFSFSIVFALLSFPFTTFLYEQFNFQYKVSCGTWVKPCVEYATQSLEEGKVMRLLKIRTMLSILALIAWIGVSRCIRLI